jgi:hypothetical protein
MEAANLRTSDICVYELSRVYGLFLPRSSFGGFCGGGLDGLPPPFASMTFTGFLSGRLSPPLPWAKAAPVDTSVAITNAAIISRNFLLISTEPPHAISARMGGRKRCAAQKAARQVPEQDSARQGAFCAKV